jgi:DDE superfamily endonuclease
MRSSSVYANPTCPAAPATCWACCTAPPRRRALVMILLSCQRWSSAAIAKCWAATPSPCSVGSTAPTPTGSPGSKTGLGRAAAAGQPTAWQADPGTAGPTRGLDHRSALEAAGLPAISSRTLRRRVREVAGWRRPRLVAKGDPDRDQILADLRQTIAVLPEGAVVLAEDETHINLLPWVRATWIVRGTRQQVMTPGTNRRRSIFGAIDLATGRFFHQVARKAISATFTTFLEQLLVAYPTAPVVAVMRQRHHPPLQTRPAVADHPSAGPGAARRALQPPRQPDRADLGHARGVAGRLPDADHPGLPPSGAHLLPPAHPGADAGHRRATQLTLAARRLRAVPQAAWR